jgi:hypothetical protein
MNAAAGISPAHYNLNSWLDSRGALHERGELQSAFERLAGACSKMILDARNGRWRDG